MAAWTDFGNKGDWLMVFKQVLAMAIAALMLFASGVGQAAPFTELDKLSSYYGLRNGPKEYSYHTPDGMLTIKLTCPNRQADMVHIVAWLKGREVYNYALPFVDTGYVMRFYRDEASRRVFLSCSSSKLAILAGYSGYSRHMETFVDSRNYDVGFEQTHPWIYVQDGELRLVLSDGYGNVPILYQDVVILDWDEGVQWINFTDTGVRPFHR